MQKVAEEIYGLSEKMIQFYLGEIQLEEVLPFLDEGLSWYGIRKGECGSSLEEAMRYYGAFSVQEDIGYWAENVEHRDVASSKDVFIVDYTLDLCYQNDDYVSKLPIIVTFIYRMGEGGIKLLSFHMSIRTRAEGSIEEMAEDFSIEDYSVGDISKDFVTKLYSGDVAKKMIKNYLLHNHGAESAALLLVDVDDFQQVNEVLDFSFGDQILKEMGERLRALFRRTDIIARLESDKFLVFMKDIGDSGIVFEKGRKIGQLLNDMYSMVSTDAEVTVTVGAACTDEKLRTYEDLLECATRALEYAKSKGKGQLAVYDSSGYRQPAVLGKESGSAYEKSDVIPVCLNLLTENKDSKVAITKVLETIGDLYGLDRAYLIEFSKEEKNGCVSYEWYAEGKESRRLFYSQLSLRKFHKALEAFDQEEKLIWTAGTKLPECCEDCIPKVSGTGFQILVHAQDKPVGVLGLEYPKPNYSFTREEISLFQYISKLLGVKIQNIRYEQEIGQLSGFDAVTGLINFVSFCNCAEELLSERQGGRYVMCTFELNSLNKISEWHGYATANKVVKHFVDLLKSVIPSIYFITRNGYSVFHLLAGADDKEQFVDTLNDLYKDEKLYLGEETIPFTFSGGVYFFDGSEKTDISYVIDRSDIARKNVPENQHTFVIYDSALEKKASKEKKIASRMEEALRNHEFKIYVQPKYRISDESFIGAEALTRWISPRFGFLPPNQFIPLFEKNEFIVQLDFYVLRETCNYLQRRFDNQLQMYPISANQSRVTISRTDYIKWLEGLLKDYSFPHKYLEIEIIESSFGDNLEEIIQVVKEIKKLGCLVDIDDFGSGYSSLNMIRRIPFDVLKIDRGFLPEKDFNDNSLHILESVVEMARKIDVKVICEGVETRDQIDYLEQSGCDQVQGFYFAKPMPIEIFDEYIYNAKRSEETLKRVFEVSLEAATKKLSGIYGKKFYVESPRCCPNRTRQIMKLVEVESKDRIGVKTIFQNGEIKGSLFIMVKKMFAISMLNNELNKDDDEIVMPLFQLNENAIVKLEEMGRVITEAYAQHLEEKSGVEAGQFSVEVFKENAEDMIQYAVSEMNAIAEKVQCMESRIYIHRNYREEMVAQVFLFMDKEGEKLVIDSIQKRERDEAAQTNNA